jgi:hypothetical protein
MSYLSKVPCVVATDALRRLKAVIRQEKSDLEVFNLLIAVSTDANNCNFELK